MPMLEYSVVVPFGKLEGNIFECVTSVLRQAVLPRQVVIVCNGVVTTEHAESVLRPLRAENKTKLNIVDGRHCTNANFARNLGVKFVQTEWCGFLDSDDRWSDTWVISVTRRIEEQHDGEFCYGSLVVNTGLENILVPCCQWSDYGSPENYLLSYQSAQTSSFFGKTALIAKIGWDETLRRHQDYDFFVRMVRSGANVVAVTSGYVHVDWSRPRRHQFHRDCIRVIDSWRGRVSDGLYRAHMRRLLKSAVLSKDFSSWLPLLTRCF